jgi:nucleoside permease NupC
LEDDAANNPVTVLIGMDGPIIGETSVVTSDFSDYMDVENFIDMPDENDSKVCQINHRLLSAGFMTSFLSATITVISC